MSVYPPNHTPFNLLYTADVGVTAPHDATLGVSLPAVTSIPVGTVEMRGYNALDVIFYGDTADSKIKYEVVYYYRLQTGPVTADPDDRMYVPLQFATAATDNLIGAEVGLAGGIVPVAGLFVDTLVDTITLAAHATGLQNLHHGTTPGATVPELIQVSNATSDGIAMLHLNHITADWVRIHIYKGAATSYVTANALTRRVNR